MFVVSAHAGQSLTCVVFSLQLFDRERCLLPCTVWRQLPQKAGFCLFRGPAGRVSWAAWKEGPHSLPAILLHWIWWEAELKMSLDFWSQVNIKLCADTTPFALVFLCLNKNIFIHKRYEINGNSILLNAHKKSHKVCWKMAGIMTFQEMSSLSLFFSLWWTLGWCCSLPRHLHPENQEVVHWQSS